MLNRAQAHTATDVVNFPVYETTIEINGREVSTNKAFIIIRDQDYHILTSLGKSITLDLSEERLCI